MIVVVVVVMMGKILQASNNNTLIVTREEEAGVEQTRMRAAEWGEEEVNCTPTFQPPPPRLPCPLPHSAAPPPPTKKTTMVAKSKRLGNAYKVFNRNGSHDCQIYLYLKQSSIWLTIRDL